jgi:hypothetical protein
MGKYGGHMGRYGGHMGKYGAHMGKNGEPFYCLGHMDFDIWKNNGELPEKQKIVSVKGIYKYHITDFGSMGIEG